MEPKFKKGDWVFCEFVLQMVKETKDDRITSVTDGFFEMGGRDLSDRCYPLTIKNKRISDEVQGWRTRFHALNAPGLNYPDLIRELVRRWIEMCEANEKDLQKLYDSLGEFGRKIENRVQDLKYEEVDGVNIFR